MGVRGLYSHLRLYRRTIQPTQGLPPLRIGVDAMSFLYRYKAYYAESYPWLDALKAGGHKLLFVFDGKPPASKEAEVKERRDVREGATKSAEAIRAHLSAGPMDQKERELLELSLARLEHQSWHLTRDIRHEIQDALRSRAIPFVKATQEADQVLVDLAHHKKLDVVLSTDMDYLLSGVPRLWIPQGSLMDHAVEEIELAEVLREESLTAEQFRDAGILCGVEPLRGHPTMPPKKAFGHMRHYGSIEEVARRNGFDFLFQEDRLAKAREHFAAGSSWSARIREDHVKAEWDFLSAL